MAPWLRRQARHRRHNHFTSHVCCLILTEEHTIYIFAYKPVRLHNYIDNLCLNSKLNYIQLFALVVIKKTFKILLI